MKKRLLYVFLFIFASMQFVSQVALAVELQLKLENVEMLALENEKNPQPTAFCGDPFQLTLTIINLGKNTEDIKISGMSEFQILGKNQQTNMSVINGRSSTQTNYFYQISTDKEGNFEIGPAEIKDGNNIVKSNTVKFRVVHKPQDISKVKTADNKSLSEASELTCELITDKKTVFQGEPLTLTVKITVNGQIRELGIVPISYPGLTAKELGQTQRRQEPKDGKLIEILETKIALIAGQSGTKTLSPVKVIYTVPVQNKRRSRGLFDDAFFAGIFDQLQMQQKQTYTNSLKINVKPLPPTQEKTDLSGTFRSFTMTVDKTTALVNEAIALTLQVEGSCNFDQFEAPKLQVPECIKNYESKKDFVPLPDLGPFGGRKIFEYVIQVSTQGTIKIPAQKLSYFDIDSKTYKTIQTNEITLQVMLPAGEKPQVITPTPVDQADTTKQTEKKPLTKDIGFIEEEALIKSGTRWQFAWWIFLLILLFPVIFVFNLHKKLVFQLKATKFFRVFAKKTSLSKFQAEFEKHKEKNEASKIYMLFLNLLATKFEVDAQLITTDFIIQRLMQLHWEDKKINDFTDFLNECASLHFISTKQKTDINQIAGLFKKSQYWIMLLTNQNQ